MPGTWKSDHLLNLVLVARADGELQPIEVLFLSRCRARIDGSAQTLADAVMRSYWEEARRTGSILSDESTLRDMVRMAIVDGAVDAREQELVFRFIDAAHLPSHRVEAIVREELQGMDLEREGIRRDTAARIPHLP